MIRTTATFQTSIPDDTVETEDEIIKFGGCAVARVIGELLVQQGFEVEEPDYAGEHGWEFPALIVRDKVKTRLWFTVTLVEFVILIAEDATFAIFAKTDRTMLGRTLMRLNEQMAADKRFSDVKWFGRNESFEEQGSPTPIA